MFDNTILLEDSIGDAKGSESFLQSYIAARKSEYYEKFGDKVREKQEKA